MSLLPPVFQALQANPALVDLLGTAPFRVFPHGSAPQDPATVRPYVTWQLVAGIPANTLSERPSADQQTIQIDCWADTGVEVNEVALLVRDTLEPLAHMTGIVIDSRETDTKLYRISLQFDWWQYRSVS